MKINVRLFARLREQLGDSVQCECPEGATVAALTDQLASQGDNWAQLKSQEILCAVNQQQVSGEHRLSENDEVAFFPPVTGG